MSETTKPVVLVVDDEKQICDLIQKALNRFSYEAVVATDAMEALVILERVPEVRLVLSDIRMPRANGIDLLQEIHKTRPGLPIVLMTGFGGMDQYFEVMNMGASDYLTKPFKILDLVRSVETALGVACAA